MRERSGPRFQPLAGAAALWLGATSAHAIKPADIAIPSAPAMHGNPGSSQVFTVADPKLKADVLALIGGYEAATGGSPHPSLQTARSLGRAGSSYVERWMLASNGKSVVYRVTLTPSPKGGVDFTAEKIPN